MSLEDTVKSVEFRELFFGDNETSVQIQWIDENRLSPLLTTEFDCYGDTLIHHAIKNDNYTLIEYCISTIPNLINCPNKGGKMPIDYAFKYGSLKTLTVLFNANPVINNINNCFYKLIDRYIDDNEHKYLEYTINKLIELGLNININKNIGFTLLQWAVYRQKVQIVRVLLKKGADPNCITYEPNHKNSTITALAVSMKPDNHILLLNGIEEYSDNHRSNIITKLLLKYGANPNVNTVYHDFKRTQSILEYAISEQDKFIVMQLLKCKNIIVNSNHIERALNVSIPNNMSNTLLNKLLQLKIDILKCVLNKVMYT